MKIGKINVGASYEDGIPRWLKCDIDATPEGDETPEQVMDKIKQIIDGWQKANSPLNLFSTGVSGPDIAPPVINRAHERLMILIENAKSVIELEGYRTSVEDANDGTVNKAFNEKWRSLMR